MRLDEIKRYGTAAAAAKAVRNTIKGPPKGHVHHHQNLESVREAVHREHRIFIKTKYSILVDGKRVATPLHLTTDGQIRCHALPNYSFSSAVDMVKQLIDAFPDDFGGADGRGTGHVHPAGHGSRHAAPTRGALSRKRTRRKTSGSARHHH